MRHFTILAFILAAACGNKKPEEGSLPRCETPVSGERISMRQVAQVSGSATLATSPPNDLRLFVVEQRGAIRILNNEQLLPTPFLDLSVDAGGPVRFDGEMGLLGLAFHPKYATNGTFFIFYTTTQPGNVLRDVLVRCSVSPDNADIAMPGSCVDVLSIPDFAGNHNGGMIEFGKDGYLYIGTGDGGGGGDPNRNGQSLEDGSPLPGSIALLGKILRIDIDRPAAGKEYGIPSDNPFARGGGAPEIFIIGVRNPWRWTFDRKTGDMWIADVGQGEVEEVTALRPAQQKGANLGWNIFEGNRCYLNNPQCAAGGMVVPQENRLHSDEWVSITGGQVYRGTCYPDIVGWYFYGDFGKGAYAKARLREDDKFDIVDLEGTFPGNPASIHEDARGELFVTTTSGAIYHIEAGP